MSRIGVGVIGSGGIAAKLHLPQLAAEPGFEIRILGGRSAHRLELLQQKYGGRIATNYREVIDAPDVDAVVVATPHPLHVEWGIEAIRAGKHLLMQKPLCGQMDEAERFADAAAAAQLTILCLPHFVPEIHTLRRLVAAGALGVVSGAYARTSHGGPEVYYAEVRDYFREQESDLWFFDKQRASVGSLFDMGVYAVAMLVAVLGSVRSVFGRTTTVGKPTELEDSASLLLDFERGCTAAAETSWCDAGQTWLVHVHGSKRRFLYGTLERDGLVSVTPGSQTREDAKPIVENVPIEDKVGNAHEHWLDCIRAGRQPPLSNWQAARHVTEILLAGLESSRRLQPVDVHSRC